jgi:hypothetical protein
MVLFLPPACRTGHFVACTGFDLTLQLASDLLSSVVINDRTNVAMTRIDGTVVAGAGLFPNQEQTETFHIADTDFMDEAEFKNLTSIANWDSEWDPKKDKDKLYLSFVDSGGQKLSAVPSPIPPEECDPRYCPDFWIIVSTLVENSVEYTSQYSDADEENMTFCSARLKEPNGLEHFSRADSSTKFSRPSPIITQTLLGHRPHPHRY